ncbi:MAG: hypothetical protein A2015_10825 [Spirochaetes bacterium GWF1_31_7]|nr:MAG: hypothetical protein A2Y30_12960 [Spirochaetes bacterium GWE1_32_154]OHD48352.1 MAG: hypothetical protein A2015_10825 [Spirochaetes bacterium GWF1_31_7]OHD81907.1 MAG: hypothetical protein A2355_16415 [Spirochaetes bacterium RIFOXYB1_FULL_32_8]HBD96354.1 GNAT family N-acetyltransferase [Spirochaetia bacterium]HBI38334.1 GNAT family N-acetyltransferase [Spirochaetia bacterium]
MQKFEINKGFLHEALDINNAKKIIEKSMKTEMIKYLVAEDNGKIIGSCYLVIIPNITNNCRSIGFIENVITDENYRGKGIGKNIIRKAIELSKNENCYKVILQSGMKRERAHTFYEKLGFDGESKKAFDLRLEEN